MPVVWAVEVLVREERGVQVSEKFTASNGVVIAEDERGLTLSTTDWRKGREAVAELFLHERDQELGRWRDPNDRDFVVYPSACIGESGKPAARVLNEENGLSALCKREDETQHTAAGAYFAAHPLPKPWHDAKPGEVWAVTWEGVESACVVELQDGCVRGRAFVPTDGKRETPGVMASIVTAGRRIWPEVVES